MGKILNFIGRSDAQAAAFEILVEEEKCGRQSQAFLAMIFLLDSKKSTDKISSQILKHFLEREIGEIKNRKDLGEQSLMVHLLMTILKRNMKNDDLGLILFPLLQLGASQHVEVSTLALECLQNVAKTKNMSSSGIFLRKYLDSLVSVLLPRLRHVDNYPTSPKVFSLILDLIEKSSEKIENDYAIISAFGEIVKSIELSSGRKLPGYISALSALSRFFRNQRKTHRKKKSTIPLSMDDLRSTGDFLENELDNDQKLSEPEIITSKLLESCSCSLEAVISPQETSRKSYFLHEFILDQNLFSRDDLRLTHM